ncbi:type VII secretion protein EccE [Gordonia sp. X0973]|uniref:type VII secretion protein EccE n=1 Tax=Gordonia sp. X0973 TaxID=2742602 RepID=UPI0013E9ACED|nr:type VII secretion protein EccE [Gordonia sp. X0973]
MVPGSPALAPAGTVLTHPGSATVFSSGDAPSLTQHPKPLYKTVPLWTIVVTELLAVALFAVLELFTSLPVWATALVAVIVGVGLGLLLATPRGGMTLGAHLQRRLAFWRRTRAEEPNPRPPFDVPTPDGGLIGLRWDGTELLSVLRVATRPGELTRLSPGVGPERTLNVGTIARALHQFDIEVTSIDIITHGWQTRTSPYLARVYTELVGTLGAVAHQDVFLVMRLNPAKCPDAVASRGGGPTGALRTAISATRRLANRMAAESYHATALTAAEITALSAQLMDGMQLRTASEQWNGVDWAGYRSAVYALGPSLDVAALQNIWSHPGISVTTRTAVQNDNGSGIHSIDTLVRYGTTGPLTQPPSPELSLLEGDQLPALRATLPLARQQLPVAEGLGTVEDLDSIHLAIGGCGQLVGADEKGRAVAMNLFGPRVKRVEVWGGLTLVQQIVLRASVIGARILIHTDRPEVWRTMVDAVAAPASMWVSAWRMPAQQALPQYTLCLLDSDEAVEDANIATHIRVHRRPAMRMSLSDGVDLAFHQDSDDPTTVTVVSPGSRTRLRLVSTNEERQLFGNRKTSAAQ